MRNSGKTLCQNLLLHSWGQYTKSEHGKHIQEHLYTSKTEVILKKNDFSALYLYIQLRGYIEMCWGFQIMPTRVSADDEISHLIQITQERKAAFSLVSSYNDVP